MLSCHSAANDSHTGVAGKLEAGPEKTCATPGLEAEAGVVTPSLLGVIVAGGGVAGAGAGAAGAGAAGAGAAGAGAGVELELLVPNTPEHVVPAATHMVTDHCALAHTW